MHGPFKIYMKLLNTASFSPLSHLFLLYSNFLSFPYMWTMQSEVEQDSSVEEVCVTICKDSVHSTPILHDHTPYKGRRVCQKGSGSQPRGENG